MAALQAQVVLRLGDGEYCFALKCRHIENLERLVGANVSDIAYRVIGLRPSISDIKHIIILGLEGGGMPPEQALAMFDRYVDGRPLFIQDDPSSPALVAAKVMEAAWFGVSEVLAEDQGKKESEAEELQAAPLTSPPTEPRSSKQGSRRRKSAK